MEKVLNQTEIDAMVRSARSATGSAAGAQTPTVEPWDIVKAGQIGPVQMAAIQKLHEAFALGLSRALSAYLRTGFEVTLASAEHLEYRELVQSFPQESYVASCTLSRLGTSAVLQLDHTLAFPILDLLLGGEGKTAAPARAITSVEEQIIEEISRIICRELQTTWQVLPLEFSFHRRELSSQADRLMPSEQKVLSLSFEMHIGEVRGTLNVAVPAVASYALVRKISAESVHVRSRAFVDDQAKLERLLLLCPFEVELSVARVQIPMRDLAELAPGKLLVSSLPAGEKAQLVVSGKAVFDAMIAKRNDRRVARVLGPVSSTATKEAA